jgi:hypothetical protein
MTIMRVVVLLALASTVGAADIALVCPTTANVGVPFTASLVVDTGPVPLGAYGVTLTYDANAVSLTAVDGLGGFSTFTNPATFTNGTTRISGYQAMTLDGPIGATAVAMVTGLPARVGTAAMAVTVRSLYDTGAAPIAPASGVGCGVSVRRHVLGARRLTRVR